MPGKKRNYKRKRKPKSALTKAQYNEVKRIDVQQEFKRAPMLRLEKWYNDSIQATDLSSLSAVCQAPYQDIPLGVGTLLDQGQRLSSIIYPQVLKSSFTLLRKSGSTSIQRFRVVVVRYHGEMDFTVDNSMINGWDLADFTHNVRPGELWSAKPYVKGQIKVLYDKTYVINDTNKSGVVVNLSVPIKRKMVYETTSTGSSAVGAGNIFIGVTSDRDFNIYGYRTYAFYKDLQ